METTIKLIERQVVKEDVWLGTQYRVTVNGEDAYTPFTDELAAKAAAFDQCCIAQMSGRVRVEYLSV